MNLKILFRFLEDQKVRFTDLSMEVLHYYARCNSLSLTYEDEILEEYTKDDGGKSYLGKVTPKMEDFLINKFGFKYHFNE